MDPDLGGGKTAKGQQRVSRVLKFDVKWGYLSESNVTIQKAWRWTEQKGLPKKGKPPTIVGPGKTCLAGAGSEQGSEEPAAKMLGIKGGMG